MIQVELFGTIANRIASATPNRLGHASQRSSRDLAKLRGNLQNVAFRLTDEAERVFKFSEDSSPDRSSLVCCDVVFVELDSLKSGHDLFSPGPPEEPVLRDVRSGVDHRSGAAFREFP